MDKERVIIPTKEEVKRLLAIINNDKTIHIQTVGELLGMKWADDLISTFKGAPEWGYEGLKRFFVDYGIVFTDTLEEAENKLK